MADQRLSLSSIFDNNIYLLRHIFQKQKAIVEYMYH